MRIQLAEESRQRKAAEAATLKAKTEEEKRRIASAKAAYLSKSTTAERYRAWGKPLSPRAIATEGGRSPSQQFRHKYYDSPSKSSRIAVHEDAEPGLW